MKTEAKKELYDILFTIGQRIMNYHDPCDWNGGTCVRMRSVEGDKGCCEGCEHLDPKGCTVKSLYCKLWLCDSEPRIQGVQNGVEDPASTRKVLRYSV